MQTNQPNTPDPEDDQKQEINSAGEQGKVTEDETLKNMMVFMEALLKEIEKDEQNNSSNKNHKP
jgi:hypothetical protein